MPEVMSFSPFLYKYMESFVFLEFARTFTKLLHCAFNVGIKSTSTEVASTVMHVSN